MTDKRLLTEIELSLALQVGSTKWSNHRNIDTRKTLGEYQDIAIGEAVLAKVDRQDSPDMICPECKGRKYVREVTQTDPPDAYIEDCPTRKGTGRVPDREKIAECVYYFSGWDGKTKWEDVVEREVYYDCADQILAIIGDVEELRDKLEASEFHNKFCQDVIDGLIAERGDVRKQERAEGWQDVIDYLENEIATVEERSAGEPKFKAHFNALEKITLQTVAYALKEGKQALSEGEKE